MPRILTLTLASTLSTCVSFCGLPAMAMSAMDLPRSYPPSEEYIVAAIMALVAAALFAWLRPRMLFAETRACMGLAAVGMVLMSGQCLATDQTYAATVVKVIDGDSVRVTVPAWAQTPFGTIEVRIAGIDTPETRKPPAKCKAEVEAGKAASAYAKGLVRPGDAVTLQMTGFDKYNRIDGAIALPDGRDWASVMLGTGMARPYAGGTKSSWCRTRGLAPAK